MEKIAKNQTIIQYLPYVTRWDYLATMFTEVITVNVRTTLEFLKSQNNPTFSGESSNFVKRFVKKMKIYVCKLF
ncbi:hypothetical protein MtrunA17_Chr4g0065841 [Medicago truncatula]|uniref:Uncharacterized protein n=1 Tax=Medicago truncatula TaxID=3880 RepID=A0A396IEW9_MEDTR|nr:hypothetical protein MtrunA17_Chr4g0065841 [Medicago truncatula]